MLRPPLAVLAVIVIAGCGSGSDSGSGSGDPVADYCAYGAVSRAQLQGCEDHVTTEDIDALDTNAARYSRGEIDACRWDAGPFCEER